MGLDRKVGVCLASQQIRAMIESGRIVSALDESRIQPSSFEPTTGSEAFILDTEVEGIFRPKTDETIYSTLLQLPQRQRRKVDISGGFELKKGFTYLVPLEERLIMSSDEYIKSSPKSSSGRIFLNSRLLTDFNPCFDEVIAAYKHEQELMMWLLMQPLTFNLILYPGLALSQLRFFTGSNSQLVAADVMNEFASSPLLLVKDADGTFHPARPIITDDGLQIHLDLSGMHTEGIVGLRARHNPEPIDLSRKGAYNAEDFFEPIVSANGRLTIRRGEHYLLASNEVLRIPSHLNAELAAHSHIGITGPLHFAGFIDNGFEGDVVYEVRSDELSNMVLEDGMPVSRLRIYRTDVPDKLYGRKIGSHYQGQVGPKTAKYFGPFDFTHAARNYKKLDRLVLVQDRRILLKHRKGPEGFEYIAPEDVKDLFRDINSGFFHSRYDCETDEEVLQFIPYCVVFGHNHRVFMYVRAKDIEDYGDERLFGKHSVGLGGHVIKSDGPDYIRRCLEREVMEEEVKIDGSISEPQLMGTLVSSDRPVDRVHFGLVYVVHTDGDVKPAEASIISGRMTDLRDMEYSFGQIEKFETWSRLLVPRLDWLYQKSLERVIRSP